MTQTQSARPNRPRRWFASIWATSVFSAAGSAVLQFYNGGAFDVAWMARAMLLMSLPFLMADRMTMLVSARARRIMGRQFRYFVATTYATLLGVMLILLNHDSTGDQAAVEATVNVVIAIFLGVFMSGTTSAAVVQTPDLADRYLDLDKLVDGNWFLRAGHLWWTPFAAALWLVLLWTNRDADDLTYTWFLLVLSVAVVPALPIRRPPFHRNPFSLTGLVGLVPMLGVLWLWISMTY
ncbi:MAG: hypothetical protein RI538_07830 [Salibaculum sp.]|jgi:hypothetical protein|uniref:hypothetical protein n=1 Tax=Salibaculum sp. TaxID=2855480 RepID=UPI0028700BAD|nr:hypothetical protein [Salibaculum sp.]MDR9427248.1 hypothetical protein [Salibaculum sp.]MDR9482680.1 hypothetical protein [Salibaculum sp.]